MKKFVCFFACLVGLAIVLALGCFAEKTNIAPNGLGYSSSEKNSLWTPPKSINDGTLDWHGWEPKYPLVSVGQDTSNGFSGEYCGIKFLNRQYYEISKVNFTLGLHSMYGGQNCHYKVEFLIEGVWVTAFEFNDSDTQPNDYATYDEAMANDTSNYHIGATYSYTLDTAMTTNNVRISVSNYAKNYPGGDSLIFPYIYEVELIGIEGVAPEIDLPEGAVVSDNIAYQSYVRASSSKGSAYPYQAIDGKTGTGWSPTVLEKGQYIEIEFTKVHTVSNIVLNFGDYKSGLTYENYSFDLEAYVNGTYQKLASGQSNGQETLITEYSVPDVQTNKVRLVFTQDCVKTPKIYEFEVHITDEKTYYSENRFTSSQRVSASKGNIGVVGVAYAENNLLPYSEVTNVNDGKSLNSSPVWFTGVLDVPTYCGIRFDKTYRINRICLYSVAPKTEGDDIMTLQVQAKVGGSYQTIAVVKSYDADMKYQVGISFDTVETDDIRVTVLAGGGTLPHLIELEIYQESGLAEMFDGITAMAETPQFKEISALNPTVPKQVANVEEKTENEKISDQKDDTPILIVACVCGGVAVCTVITVIILKKRKKEQ